MWRTSLKPCLEYYLGAYNPSQRVSDGVAAGNAERPLGGETGPVDNAEKCQVNPSQD